MKDTRIERTSIIVAESRRFMQKLNRSLACLLALGTGTLLTTQAIAQITITEYPLPAGSGPLGVCSGPDGNVWFAEQNSNRIGRITPNGGIHEFPGPTGNVEPGFITKGPDDNLWFTEWNSNNIGRITTGGQVTQFPIGATNGMGITVGPDQNLWYILESANRVGRMTTSGDFTEFAIPTGSCIPCGITTGPDDKLWFVERVPSKIGRATTQGDVEELQAPSGFGIAKGSDGNLWYTVTGTNAIARITPAGVWTMFPIPVGSHPRGITQGPDGNMWFTLVGILGGIDYIGRITMAGAINCFPIPTLHSEPLHISCGPDGNLWFTEYLGNNVGKVVAPWDAILPASYLVISGFQVSGNLASILESDNDCLGIFPDDTSLIAQVTFYGVSAVQTPTTLTFNFEGSVARFGLSQSVQLFNYARGGFDTVDGRIAPHFDTPVTVTMHDSAPNYIGPGGALEAQIVWQPVNDEDPSQDGWLHCVDIVRWTARQD